MRPAFQRLLDRPSSLLLLRRLAEPSSSFDNYPQGILCMQCSHRTFSAIAKSLKERRRLNQSKAALSSLNKLVGFHSKDRPSGRFNGTSHNAASQSGDSRSSNDLFNPSMHYQRDLPREAIAHKQLSYEELLYESDVGHEDVIGSRLVDRPPYREDFKLWLQLLLFQQEHRGNIGVLDIWRGMMIRCRDLELPVDGKVADQIWGIFVHFGIEDQDFLETVYRYAQWLWKEKRKRWPKLYTTVLRGILKQKRPRYSTWHIVLKKDHLNSPNDLSQIFPWEGSDTSQYAFMMIYLDVPSPRIYSDIIPRLCQERRFDEALRWHKVFVKKSDVPRPHEVAPLLQYLRERGQDEELQLLEEMRIWYYPMTSHEPAKMAGSISGLIATEDKDATKQAGDLPFKKEPLKDYSSDQKADESPVEASLSEERIAHRSPLGESFRLSDAWPAESIRVEPRTGTTTTPSASRDESTKSFMSEEKSDMLSARLLATHYFGFELVLILLQTLGIKKIGYRSVREVALRAGSPVETLEMLRQFKKIDVQIGKSAYAALVWKLAANNNQRVLQTVLASDMDPKVFGDRDLQESLLTQYQRENKPEMAEMVLAILTLARNPEAQIWNLRLKAAVINMDRYEIKAIIETMQEKRLEIHPHTIDLMFHHLLLRRSRGKPEERKDPNFDNLGFLITLWQSMLQTNSASIFAYQWRDVIKRLGMDRTRWSDLESLLLWLASYYAPIEPQHDQDIVILLPHPSRLDPNRRDRVPFDKRRVFEELFTPDLQRSIVEWGFLAHYRRQDHADEPKPKMIPSVPQPHESMDGNALRSPHHTQFLSIPAGSHVLIPWTRGLLLVKKLTQYGLEPNINVIRHACRHRLRYYFGVINQAMINSPAQKRKLRKRNHWTLLRFLVDAETAWPGLWSSWRPPPGQPSGVVDRHDKGTSWIKGLVNPTPSVSTRRRWNMRRKETRTRGVRMRDGYTVRDWHYWDLHAS